MLGALCTPKELSVRFEFQIAPNAKLLSKVKNIEGLRKKFPKLSFVKYVYIDPADGVLKGTNPPNDIPIVPNAYITVMGTLSDIKALIKEATT